VSNNLYVSERHNRLYARWLTNSEGEWLALLASFGMKFPASTYDRRHRGWAISASQAGVLERWAAPRFEQQFWQDGRMWGPVEREVAS
jgi:hypothetical protein